MGKHPPALISMYEFSLKDFAATTKSFWVIEVDNTDYAVVDTYNNNFIAIPVNLDDVTFKTQFKFITPEEVSDGFFFNVVKEKPLKEELN
ncbi:hypothetical protein [Paenibacillus sp. FSL A5-0031]|uniref:hypothetical protein n=1 Tax=Paenibacillus sp. FSL A5-0031 TaxID=1920420 RepID=UPI0011856D61|nr:hypothetical protein [Paenibacillus sp. FSL A5-0031]